MKRPNTYMGCGSRAERKIEREKNSNNNSNLHPFDDKKLLSKDKSPYS